MIVDARVVRFRRQVGKLLDELAEQLLDAINTVQQTLRNELNNTNSILTNLASSVTNINGTLNNLLAAIENLVGG